MKTILSIILSATLLLSCKKESSNCKKVIDRKYNYIGVLGMPRINEHWFIITDNGTFEVSKDVYNSKPVGSIYCNN